MLDDLREHGAPEGDIVHVERIVRTRAAEGAGGVATQGVLVTARRADEILSAWVVVGRVALDPWGQPLDQERAKRQTQRHQEAQRVIGAQVADAGYAVRTGLYLLPDAGYSFAATSEALSEALAVAISRSNPEESPAAPLTPAIAEPAPRVKSPRAQRHRAQPLHTKPQSRQEPRSPQASTDDEAGGLPHA
ncbi:MAG TPA: hypothetical protein VE338_11415 [Ktedonobacterales bacterium]|nr:hypothetical protein [Ktedonobacterales bacterium]